MEENKMLQKLPLGKKLFLLMLVALFVVPSPTSSVSAGNKIFVQFFPWKFGATWKLTQDFHGTLSNGKPQNALDFATLDGKPGKVFAADDGIVLSAKETCIIIKRSDDLQLGYQHISKSDIANWAKKVGKKVYAGDYIGMTTLVSGCGGKPGGHHVHFWAQGVLGTFTFGSEIAGWTIREYTYKYPGGVTQRGAKMTFGINDGVSLYLQAIVCLKHEGSTCKHDKVVFREYRND
jgi:hypothetical protein